MAMSESIRLSKPKYNIGDTVFLKESAAFGFLEAYLVQLPIYKADGSIYYRLATGARAPIGVQTIGDRINGLAVVPLILPEHDLIAYCDALSITRDNLTLQLSQINNLITKAECPDIT